MSLAFLKEIMWEQSALAKIDIIYNCLKFKVAEDVDQFWEGSDRFKSASQRNIDIDNLQGISIYLVWASQRPDMIVDLFLIEEFISASTKKSTRSMYLNVLKASIDFLLDMQINENDENEEEEEDSQGEDELQVKTPEEMVTDNSPCPPADQLDSE